MPNPTPLESAIILGGLADCKRLVEQGHKVDGWCAVLAVRHERIDILEWMKEHYLSQLMFQNVLDLACDAKGTSGLAWYRRNIPFREVTQDGLMRAAAYNRVSVLYWIKDHYQYARPITWGIETAAAVGARESLEFIKKYYGSRYFSNGMISSAAEYGHIRVLKWIKRNFTNMTCPTFAIDRASRCTTKGLKTMKWLKKNYPYVDCTEGAFNFAAGYPNKNALVWLKKNYPDVNCSYLIYLAAAVQGGLECLDWIRENYPELKAREFILCNAVVHNRVDVIVWLRKHFPHLDNEHSVRFNKLTNLGTYITLHTYFKRVKSLFVESEDGFYDRLDCYTYLTSSGFNLYKVSDDEPGVMDALDSLFILESDVPLNEPRMNSASLVRRVSRDPKELPKRRRFYFSNQESFSRSLPHIG